MTEEVATLGSNKYMVVVQLLNKEKPKFIVEVNLNFSTFSFLRSAGLVKLNLTQAVLSPRLKCK